MIKNYLILIFLFCSGLVFAQEGYFSSGKNYTKYIYKDANLVRNRTIQSGTGNYYELGYTKKFIIEKLFYSLGMSLNEYNATGGNTASSYRWDTQYLGINGGLSYNFYSFKSIKEKKVNLFVETGLNVSSLIYGKQQINGIYYDLRHQKEFSGILLGSSVGLRIEYPILSNAKISLEYDLCQSVNVANSSKEKLSFNTNQLGLGIIFNIN